MNFDPQTWQLTTERLVLRGPQLTDASVLNEAIHESFAELHQWVAWAQKLPTMAESEEFARWTWEKFQRAESLNFTRLWRHDDTFVGCAGLLTRDDQVPSFEIGYWCRTRYAGQGYVSEAVRALTDYALSHLNAQRIEIRCDARNLASRRVAEKCDFALEALLHHEARAPDGKLRDSCIYARFPQQANDLNEL